MFVYRSQLAIGSKIGDSAIELPKQKTGELRWVKNFKMYAVINKYVITAKISGLLAEIQMTRLALARQLTNRWTNRPIQAIQPMTSLSRKATLAAPVVAMNCWMAVEAQPVSMATLSSHLPRRLFFRHWAISTRPVLVLIHRAVILAPASEASPLCPRYPQWVILIVIGSATTPLKVTTSDRLESIRVIIWGTSPHQL